MIFCSYDYLPNTGGVATYSYEIVRELRRRGIDVKVVTSKKKSPPPAETPAYELSLPKSGLLSIPSYTLQLIKIIKSENPQSIFCSLWSPDGISSLIALKLTGKKIPLFCAVHGTELLDSSQNFKKRLRSCLSFLKPWFFKNTQKIFPVSQFSKSLLLKWHNFEDNVQVVLNGVDTNHFQKKAPSKRLQQTLNTQGKVVFFTLARHVPHKGIDKVIKALGKIKDHPTPWVYLIGGSGPGTDYLKTMVEKLNFNSQQIQFLGKINFTELNDYYNLCDLFILLSREEPQIPSVEGFGLVFLEAASCGKPSLGSTSGGIPEAVLNNITGWTVDPKNTDLIAEKIKSILEDTNSLQTLGKNAWQRVQTELNWKTTTNQLVKSIEEFLS